MTSLQKAIKYASMAFAVLLALGIVSGLLRAVGLIDMLIDRDAVAEETRVYEISDEITALDIRIGAAALTIRQGEAFSVESNLRDLRVKEKDGTLIIEEDTSFAKSYHDAVLVLCVPEGTVFEKASIETGAGVVTVDVLSASRLKLVFGAGDVRVDTLNASESAEIVGGAGRLTVSGGELHGLDLEMGVGELILTSALLGRSDLELGIGETEITLIGGEEDYTVDIEKGLGGITVDGESVSGSVVRGHGQNKIDVSGGIGAIRMFFGEE
ncbi:MAG: DUF4097 family beta strand repeat protein [Clostridia bacterium]|nr:DUF4097 family beta strand repeat protein [Clostridia bacterium]